MNTFFHTIPRNLFGSFRGRFILFYLFAVLLTVIVVLSGLDWFYFSHLGDTWIRFISAPAFAIGALVPILWPIGLIIIGHERNDSVKIHAGWMLGQAALLSSFISSCGKALTGRLPPRLLETAADTSREFNFGFLRHGIFWGWPSSHTAIAFSMALAFFIALPRSKWRWWAIIYAAYIGLGVSITGHWLSEVLAGALIGTAIGLIVGKTYKELI